MTRIKTVFLILIMMIFSAGLASPLAAQENGKDQGGARAAAPETPRPYQEFFETRLRERLQAQKGAQYPVFGHHLFSGRYASAPSRSVNPDYTISSGDTVSVALWGAVSQVFELQVDSNGVIFVPEVGPVKVGGVSSANLNEEIRRQISRTFSRNVNVYAHLKGASQIYVFVAGAVIAPGQYEGASTDSLLRYIDKAGGIAPEHGSFRDIRIVRDGQEIGSFDLYDFLTEGKVPHFALRDGDTVLVAPRGDMLNAGGDVLNENSFEIRGGSMTGTALIALARPRDTATHVQLVSHDGRERAARYMTLAEFERARLGPGDFVDFISDIDTPFEVVGIEGPHQGPRRVVVRRGTRLKEILRLIPVDPAIADTGAVYLKRRSVAAAQKKSLIESIERLERSLAAAQISSSEEASIKQTEAALVRQFIDRVRTVEPEGRVVLAEIGGAPDLDIRVEDGDTVVIPRKTDLIRVSGEVFAPAALVWDPEAEIETYIDRAGGFSDRADEDGIVIARANGAVTRTLPRSLQPGDEIIVLPEVSAPTLEIAGKVVDIVYKAILSAVIPLELVLDD